MSIAEAIGRLMMRAQKRIAELPDEIRDIGAHGEITFVRVEHLPSGFVSIPPQDPDGFIVAHSETGHHHVLEGEGAEYMPDREDAMVAWARIRESVRITHRRANDTHRTLTLSPGLYRINHAREEDLLGAVRRVVD